MNREVTDKNGKSLLYQCVSHPACIDLVLAHGAKVDRPCGKDNQTALMRATTLGELDSVMHLRKTGADPTLEFDTFSELILELYEETQTVTTRARMRWKRVKPTKKIALRKKARPKKAASRT